MLRIRHRAVTLRVRSSRWVFMRANLLIVSDLHFGEDLLPGASAEKQRAVALGAHTFCEFLRHHSQRRMDGLSLIHI